MTNFAAIDFETAGRLARRRQRHPRLHHGRHCRGLLRPHPGRDRQRHLAPPARRIPPDLAGDAEGIGVSAGGERGVKVFWDKVGRGKGKSVVLRRKKVTITT